MEAPVGKSGPLTRPHRSSLVIVGIVDVGDHRVRDLAQVVRRDVGGHADRDPRRAVDQQVRQLGRQDRRLLLGAVVVVDVVDGVLVDVGEHLGGDRREAGLRVPHGRGGVPVDRPEVALPVHQRVAHREVLGQPDQRVVEGDVAVRVVLAHHLADDGRALAEGARRGEPHLAHRVEDPAVDRLEAVAHVRQRASDDDAHRVVEVRDAHLVLDPDGSDVAQVVGHVVALLRGSAGSGQVSVDDGALGRRDRQPVGEEVGGASPRRGRSTGRRDACGCRRGRPSAPRRAARAASRSVSRMTHAR